MNALVPHAFESRVPGLPAIDVDRIAAVDLMREIIGDDPASVERILAGGWDNHPIVQAMARRGAIAWMSVQELVQR